ncbi:hypothetical protein Gorai_020883, partial [Gossypium raimondii]|nr:hypothetical protein [Gossypium raimondii]
MSGQQEEDKKPGDQSAAHINLKVKGQCVVYLRRAWKISPVQPPRVESVNLGDGLTKCCMATD